MKLYKVVFREVIFHSVLVSQDSKEKAETVAREFIQNFPEESMKKSQGLQHWATEGSTEEVNEETSKKTDELP